jgi:hypothetical protein
MGSCVAAIVLAAALGATPAAGTTERHGGMRRCAPPHAEVVASDAQAQVFAANEPIYEVDTHRSLGDQREYRGCLDGSVRSIDLGPLPRGRACGSTVCGGVRHPVLAGTTVAYEDFTVTSTYDQWDIVVKSLVSRRVLHDVPTGAALEASAKYVGVGPVADIVLKPDGSVAWIAEDGERGLKEEAALRRPVEYYDLYKLDREGLSELEGGTQIGPRSLRLSASTLRWSTGGTPHAARLD